MCFSSSILKRSQRHLQLEKILKVRTQALHPHLSRCPGLWAAGRVPGWVRTSTACPSLRGQALVTAVRDLDSTLCLSWQSFSSPLFIERVWRKAQWTCVAAGFTGGLGRWERPSLPVGTRRHLHSLDAEALPRPWCGWDPEPGFLWAPAVRFLCCHTAMELFTLTCGPRGLPCVSPPLPTPHLAVCITAPHQGYLGWGERSVGRCAQTWP